MYDDLILAVRALEEQVQEIQLCRKHDLPIDQETFTKLVKDSEAIHNMTLDMQPKDTPNPNPKKRQRSPLTIVEREGLVKVIHVDERTNQVVTKHLREGCQPFVTTTKFNTNEEAEDCADHLVAQLRSQGFK